MCLRLAAAADQSAGPLSGAVVDTAGAAIPNASVDLQREGEWAPSRTSSTDAEGRFRFQHLAPGAWIITVKAPGFQTKRLTQTLVTNEEVKLPDVRLDVLWLGGCEGTFRRRPEIRLETAAGDAALTGVVEQHNGGTAIADASVALTSPARSYSVRTDRSGKFRFLNVRPGAYTLSLSAQGFAGFLLDALEVKLGHTTVVADALSLWLCPAGIQCSPARTVETTVLCL
jgi:hypothetical protein